MIYDRIVLASEARFTNISNEIHVDLSEDKNLPLDLIIAISKICRML